MPLYHGYELLAEWNMGAQQSYTVKARKGSKLFFLKRYRDTVKPLDCNSKHYKDRLDEFNKFYNRRKSINAAIRVKTSSGGNIVIPCDEFIEGCHYVEATEFIEGVVPDEDFKSVLSSLNDAEKYLLMLTAASSLDIVHRLGIVHSDIKPQNLLLIKKENGKYVAKLIDFDVSYFLNDIPDQIGGTDAYYSPEHAEYDEREDDRDELAKNLTEKSDIFSLGLIFHEYLCGEKPEPINLTEALKSFKDSGAEIYCGFGLLYGCDLQISPKIKSAKYISLIRDMLDKDPNVRPSAHDVFIRLKEPEPTIEDPWPEHKIILNNEKLKAEGILGLAKIEESGQRKYRMILPDGRKQLLTKDELTDKGYATQTGFEEPWPEHQIEFNSDLIESRGYVSGQRATFSGTKGYYFYKPNQSKPQFFLPDALVAMGYAKKCEAKVEIEPGADTPWPEHGIEFDEAGIKERGYVKIERDTFKGTKGYKLTRADGTSSFKMVDVLVVLNMAKKL